MAALILLKDFLETQIELWKPIAEFPGYDVSNLGRVRSWRRRGSVSGLCLESRLLHPSLAKVIKRMVVTLYRDSKPSVVQVSRLVAFAFLPNPNNWPEINHKTGISVDNRVGNLEWATRQMNQEHANEFGLTAHGERAATAKITAADVVEIRRLCAGGMTQRQAAALFGLQQPAVGSICRRETWQRVV